MPVHPIAYLYLTLMLTSLLCLPFSKAKEAHVLAIGMCFIGFMCQLHTRIFIEKLF